MTSVVFLRDADPLAEVRVDGQHLVGVEPLHNVDGPIHAHAQQSARHKKNQNLQECLMMINRCEYMFVLLT